METTENIPEIRAKLREAIARQCGRAPRSSAEPTPESRGASQLVGSGDGSARASELMQAHQYLYYVRCAPVLSDHEYDQFCKRNGLDGGGGSDRASDYPPRIVELAAKLSSPNTEAR